MIVPQYWAEGRIQQRKEGKQVTVRRFGWSDTCQAEAQAHADQRTAEALQRILSGEKLARREPKGAYNGAQGVPIREEILDRRGETIITRNSYGAGCLNSPNVLFADIDFEVQKNRAGTLVCVILVMLLWAFFGGWHGLPKVIVISTFFAGVIFSNLIAGFLLRMIEKLNGGPEKVAHKRIGKFLKTHPEWNVRIYRTPAGLRVLATHRPFDPNDAAVEECFEALGTDPVYRLMCRNQQCFRARLGPKPWRIGIEDHLRPRPGVWPVKEEHLPARHAWIENYQNRSRSFAACRLEQDLGSGFIHADVLPVMDWHDELSRATSGLPIA